VVIVGIANLEVWPKWRDRAKARPVQLVQHDIRAKLGKLPVPLAVASDGVSPSIDPASLLLM
jgi:hypothetical protein